MPEPNDDFANLLARARQGDQAALTELIRQYEPELRLAARVRLGPALRPYLDSMDIVQSVHHSLIRGLRDNKFAITNPEQLLKTAVGIVRNKIRHHWRVHRRQQRFDQPNSGACSLEMILLSLSDTGDDPGRTAELRDQIEFVCGKLDALEHRLIHLRWQGYSTAEAALEMKVDAGWLRVRLQRLRQRLQDHGIAAEFL